MDRGRQVKCLSQRRICTPARPYPGITGVPVVLFFGWFKLGGGSRNRRGAGEEVGAILIQVYRCLGKEFPLEAHTTPQKSYVDTFEVLKHTTPQKAQKAVCLSVCLSESSYISTVVGLGVASEYNKMQILFSLTNSQPRWLPFGP